MSWKLRQREHETFDRNPLVVVVSQLRFHPIVRIKQGELIGHFQDEIRSQFPTFSESLSNIITARAGQSANDVVFDTDQEKQFVFTTESGNTRIVLGATSLSIENKAHERRSQLVDDFALAIHALRKAYGSISPIRIGLRYVNQISKETLSRDLGRTVSWNEAIHPQFLRLPDCVELEDTAFYSEITSPITSGGGMTVRYGLIREPDQQVKYRFDTDRYRLGPFDVETASAIINSLSDDLFSVFMEAAGPALMEWMATRKADS